MQPACSSHQVRQMVHARLVRLGASPEQDPRETLLVRGGYYCGRRYDCDGLQAVWFIEENEIKFYGREGGVVDVARAEEVEAPGQDLRDAA